MKDYFFKNICQKSCLDIAKRIVRDTSRKLEVKPVRLRGHGNHSFVFYWENNQGILIQIFIKNKYFFAKVYAL